MSQPLSPFVESTIAAAVERLDTARELVAMAMAGSLSLLPDAIRELAAAEAGLRNVLQIAEHERRIAAMATEPAPRCTRADCYCDDLRPGEHCRNWHAIAASGVR